MLLQMPQAYAPSDEVDVAAEADHRIASHLAMLGGLFRMQADRLRRRSEPLSGDDVGTILDGLSAKVDAVSLLHRRLARAEAAARQPLGGYLRDLLGKIAEALATEGAVEIEISADVDCSVTAKQALAVGLIVCELVTNAMKYAHPSGVDGRIWVRCRDDGHVISVDVEDDGVGLPEGFDPEKGGDLGFRSIRALARQLGATIGFRNSGIGLVAELRMPVVANQ